MTVYDDGESPALYVNGWFTFSTGEVGDGVAKWDGRAWTVLDDNMIWGAIALQSFDFDGLGPNPSQLTAATLLDIQVWNGNSWNRIGERCDSGPNYAILPFDDGLGNGPSLFIAGEFDRIGGTQSPGISRWNGSAWDSVGGGTDGLAVHCLAVYDHPEQVGRQALYAGGSFDRIGGVVANKIACWDGQQWYPLGPGITAGNGTTVTSMAVFDAGTGPRLIVGGNYQDIGGLAVNNIASWDGAVWRRLGSGIIGVSSFGIHDMALFDDRTGHGSRLYVGGRFELAGGIEAPLVACWDGHDWTSVGVIASGMSQVNAFAVFDDDGDGPGFSSLFAGGNLVEANGTEFDIARWKSVLADFDCNHVVNLGDLAILLAHFGLEVQEAGTNGDVDRDGDVDLSDLALLLAHFGGC